jgi:hypothetical protein
MRARMIVLVVAVLLVAGFAALNWPEFARPTPLSFGPVIVDAPLGLIMLSLLMISLLAFLASTAYLETTYAMETRKFSKELAAQRDLADRAEASRFTELRQHIDAQVRETRQREAATLAGVETLLTQHQRQLDARFKEIDNVVAAHMGQLEDRIERRHPVDNRVGVTI